MDTPKLVYTLASDALQSGDYARSLMLAPSVAPDLPYARRTWLLYAQPLAHYALPKYARRAIVLGLQLRPLDLTVLEAATSFFQQLPPGGSYAQHSHVIQVRYQAALAASEKSRFPSHGAAEEKMKMQTDAVRLELALQEAIRAKNHQATVKCALLLLHLMGRTPDLFAVMADALRALGLDEWAFVADRHAYDVFENGVSPAVAKYFLQTYGSALRFSNVSLQDLPPLEDLAFIGSGNAEEAEDDIDSS